MTDTATIEAYMRDANPIPTVDELDPDEFARFMTTAHTKWTAITQATTQHEAPAPSRHATRQLRGRKVKAFAAGFAVIAASIGIAALALRNESPAATDGTETPEIESPGVPPIDSLQWSYVGLEDILDATQTVEDVIVGGPGLIGVGHQLRNAAVWTSPDGLNWSQVPYQDSFWEGRMTAVTTGGPGLIAVGFLTDNAYSAMVWTSPDGITWTQVPSTPDFSSGNGERMMLDVIAGGPGFVAVGSWDTTGEVFAPSAAVWTSPDGINWTRVPHDASVFFGGTPGAAMASVTTGGPGLVAVGNIGGLSDGWRAAVWTSPDGITWTPAPNRDGVFSEDEPPIIMMESVATGGPGLVAVGGDGVWTSADGINWSRIPNDEIADARFELRHVTAVGSGLVAVGTTDSSDGEAHSINEVGTTQSRAIWTSADGLTWNRVPYDYLGTDVDVEGPLVTGLDTASPAIVPVGDTVWVATPP